MKLRRTLNRITREILSNIGPILDGDRPDPVIIHCDTANPFAAALAAYYAKM